MSELLSSTSTLTVDPVDPISRARENPLRALELAIEYVPVDHIRRYKRNPRTHSKKQIRQIADSIEAFGFISPIVVDADMEVIAGHGRLAAARLLGYTSVPVVRADHLNEAQRTALRIADNRLAELSGWDEKLLSLEFARLLELDLNTEISFDLAITGFAPAEVDRLVEAANETEAMEMDDAVPPLAEQVAPVSRLGDIFVLGPHRIICGDARSSETYAALMGSELAAMGIHDAPYNVPVTNHISRSGRHREFAMGIGEMTRSEFTAFKTDFLTNAKIYPAPGAIQSAFMDWRHMSEMLAAGEAAGLELKNLAVWNKGVGAMGSLLRSQHELVFMFKEPNGPHINNVQLGKYGRNRTNVWDFPGAAGLRKELELHPTPKPVSLVAEAIKDVSNRNDIVLDAFSGSGTTIIACARTGRRARVIELDPQYVDVAVRRWEDWSGQPAHHLASGLTYAELAKAGAARDQAVETRADDPGTSRIPDASYPQIRIRHRAPK